MKKQKLIKLKHPEISVVILQSWIVEERVSNARLVSPEINRLVRKFLKDLQKIPLSEELQ